ncbi:MAG: hypothetical protein P8M22_04495 [Phycisphaerales bacterium]|nr:hypothetical protein [Phycisphaerales bacterium]
MKTSSPLMGPLGVSLLAILLIVILVVIELPPLVSSTGTAASSSAPEPNKVTHLVDSHKLAMTTDLERFNGRSFFFRPPSPSRPKPKVVTPPKKEVKVLPPPVKVDPKPVEPTYPKTYTGPDLQAIVGPTAFFRASGGQLLIINVGETEQDIELLSANAPHDIEVKYKKGGPYNVTLFEMKEPDFLNKGVDLSTSETDIIAEARDTPDDIPLLEGLSGWPAGTVAGDPVQIRYRQGPYEASITGMLTRANRAWLVVSVEDNETPIEIFKADVLSVQNLKPRPPKPEPVIEEEEAEEANATNSNASDQLAGNTNATETPAFNANATMLPGNDNSSEPMAEVDNANSTLTANDNSSANEASATDSEEPDEAPDGTTEDKPDTDAPGTE